MKLRSIIPGALIGCFLAFVILSWWLLFRDERAIEGIENFYPFLDGSMFAIREFLLLFGLNVLPTIAFALVGAVAFGAYFLALKIDFSLKKSVVFALIFQAIVFLSYPVLSTDIFSYITSHRVFTEYGQNIWAVAPQNFPTDLYSEISDWIEHPSIYGAVKQIIYLPVALLSQVFGEDLIMTVVFYKSMALLFSVGTLFVLLKTLEGKSESHRARVVRMIFWNPLFVMEIIGSGHNDILMFFFMLLGILSWQKKWWLRSGVFFALAVQVKLIPILLVGFLGLKLLQDKRFVEICKFSGSFLMINILAFIYMNVSPLSFLERVTFNTTVYWQSLPSLFEKFLPELNLPFSLIFLIVLASLALLQLKKNWQPLQTTTIALLIYVSLFTSAFWNWYILWPLMLVVFTNNNKNRQLKKIILLMTMTSLMAYPILWLSHRFGFGNPAWNVLTYLMIFGLPLAIAYFLNTKKSEKLLHRTFTRG